MNDLGMKYFEDIESETAGKDINNSKVSCKVNLLQKAWRWLRWPQSSWSILEFQNFDATSEICILSIIPLSFSYIKCWMLFLCFLLSYASYYTANRDVLVKSFGCACQLAVWDPEHHFPKCVYRFWQYTGGWNIDHLCIRLITCLVNTDCE
jgi:hypothetical protein